MFESKLIAGFCLIICPIIYLILRKEMVKEDLKSIKERDWMIISSLIKIYGGLFAFILGGIIMVVMELLK